MLKPLHTNVILKIEENENTTASGILLTASSSPRKKAVVASIGPDVEENEYEIGDTVYYKTGKALHIDLPEGEYAIVEDGDILAVLEEN